MSVALNALAALVLGWYWSLTPGVRSAAPMRVVRIAVLPKPPPPPKVLPTPKRPPPKVHVRPVVRRATPQAPSPVRARTVSHKAAKAGRGRQVNRPAPAPPVLASVAAPLRTVHARVATLPPLKSAPHQDAPSLVAAPVSQSPVAVSAPSGGESGQGKGHGDARGTGSGQSPGAGAGGDGGPFGIGGGGTGGGEGPRHIVYVLDTSGSMTSRIDRARQEIRDALGGLAPGESFDIVTFSNDAQAFDDRLDPATPRMIAHASHFLSTLRPDGGTNLRSAMERALSISGVNVVVLVTDGDPTIDSEDDFTEDTDRYFKALTRRVRALNVSHARIFTIGLVGKDPEGRDRTFEGTRLLRQISADSGGTSKIVSLGVASP